MTNSGTFIFKYNFKLRLKKHQNQNTLKKHGMKILINFHFNFIVGFVEQKNVKRKYVAKYRCIKCIKNCTKKDSVKYKIESTYITCLLVLF